MSIDADFALLAGIMQRQGLGFVALALAAAIDVAAAYDEPRFSPIHLNAETVSRALAVLEAEISREKTPVKP